MNKSNVTAEQTRQLETHAATIGHNLGPALDEHAGEIQAKVAEHPELRHYAAEIRVMFDMMRSHLSGEYLLPQKTLAFVFGGLALVAVMTTAGIVTEPFPTLLLDAAVLGFTTAALAGDIQQYVEWRAARDPSYKAVRSELAGKA